MKKSNADLRNALRHINPPAPRLSDDFADRLQRRVGIHTANGRDGSQKRMEIQAPARSEYTVLRKVAAVVVALILMGGLAYAALRFSEFGGQRRSLASDTISENPAERKQSATAIVEFENAPLDSILRTVAAHYGGRAVLFLDETPSHLRITTSWVPTEPVDSFISLLNEFEGISIQLRNDTLLVGSEKEGAES